MRSWSLAPLLLAAASCGQMYGTPNQQAQPGSQPATASGPPGSSEPSGDPWQSAVAPPSPKPSAGDRAPARRPAPPARADLPPMATLLLDAHNRDRAKHCAAPLTWSPKLAAYALSWANTLRDKSCAFDHSHGEYGENLAAGTSGALDAEATVAMWYDEIKGYSFKQPGFSMQTGHFTQVVWRGTTQVGCAMSTCKGRGMDIWVCEYDPPGNWEGQYREQVLPTSCK